MAHNLILVIKAAFVSLLLFVNYELHAVAFKLKNDTEFYLKARCFDRGNWRPWVEFPPGGWGDFAPKVTRSDHTVQIQIRVDGEWIDFYYGNHGSRVFTRIVQIAGDSNNNLYIAWWDEPPHCRDAPPNLFTGGYSCLKPSGWLWGNAVKFFKEIRKKGEMVLKIYSMSG